MGGRETTWKYCNDSVREEKGVPYFRGEEGGEYE